MIFFKFIIGSNNYNNYKETYTTHHNLHITTTKITVCHLQKKKTLTASGVTLGYKDRHYREYTDYKKYTDYKTIIITKTKKKRTIESLHLLWYDCWSTV